MKRLIVVVAALTGALLVQLTIVNGLALPGGGVPDLVLLCVVAIGLVGGPEPGLIAGFCAGLTLDLAPPANQLIGQYALVFCLIGYASGRMRPIVRRSASLALAAAAAAAVAGEVLAGCLAVVLDTPEVTLAAVLRSLPASALYDLVLSPLVVFTAVRVAVALGVSFSPLDDSPALETGGSAQPTGLARLAGPRLARQAMAGDGIGGGGNWLVSDSAAGVPAVGTVGWLSGPATSRRARREQARLSAALTGAAPRKGNVWVGSRPAGLRPSAPQVPPAQPSGLSKLRPESGVPGSAIRQGAPMAAPADASRDRHRADGAALPKIAFGTGGIAPERRPAASQGVPKIAFGTPGSPGADRASGRAAGRGVPKIAFGTGSLPGAGRPAGRKEKRIAFGTGSLPGAGPPVGRKGHRIAFGNGLPRAPRTSPGRPALPRFRPGSTRSAAGPWLAGSRLRSAQFGAAGPGRQPSAFGGGPSYLAARSYRPKTAKWRRGRRHLRWLPFWRRSGGRSAVWRIGGER
jgi:rod shape-determining protein MreD